MKVGKDRCAREHGFQEFKSPVNCLISVELEILTKKVGQRVANSVKSFDEPTIEVGKVKEGMNLLDVSWGWSVFHRFGFLSDNEIPSWEIL
jgi:hypothetical protein